jgi:hypothetical protein
VSLRPSLPTFSIETCMVFPQLCLVLAAQSVSRLGYVQVKRANRESATTGRGGTTLGSGESWRGAKGETRTLTGRPAGT